MDSEVQQQSPSNPSTILAAVLTKRAKLHEELRGVEKQVYDMETSYLHDTSQCGNVLKGFEGFLSSSKNPAYMKRSRKFQADDRLFSLSSITSQAVEEVAQNAGIAAANNGQGKPKRGRWPKEAKRSRQSNDIDYDYEDETELM